MQKKSKGNVYDTAHPSIHIFSEPTQWYNDRPKINQLIENNPTSSLAEQVPKEGVNPPIGGPSFPTYSAGCLIGSRPNWCAFVPCNRGRLFGTRFWGRGGGVYSDMGHRWGWALNAGGGSQVLKSG